MKEEEKLFLDIIKDFEWRYDEENYPHSLFLFKDDKFLFEIESKKINQKKVIAKHRLGMEQELEECIIWVAEKMGAIICENIKIIFEKHLKIKSKQFYDINKNFSLEYEKHFSNKI